VAARSGVEGPRERIDDVGSRQARCGGGVKDDTGFYQHSTARRICCSMKNKMPPPQRSLEEGRLLSR
jgi:hypothetical protein